MVLVPQESVSAQVATPCNDRIVHRREVGAQHANVVIGESFLEMLVTADREERPGVGGVAMVRCILGQVVVPHWQTVLNPGEFYCLSNPLLVRIW